ncbi:acyltransferase family protein [Asanoa sp. WMMD1127]|uniref:acyltransferase family protein n=1 Tax=Asanoa sp. WMMD1127 TaxID=3016107 RepID=UPI002416A64E|nr:acyltransferase family protein [Asanoa sp. WMMD1127]MDG4826194.1 acyltransferase family protein [Asanoa sp. WMMD1127]
MTATRDGWVGPPRYHTATAPPWQATTQALPTVDRDRWFDFLRAAAILRVVLYHMFPVAWLGLGFPAMGVMFALGGSLMAKSVDRSATRAVRGRLRRLLPALWLLAAVVVPAMLVLGWDDHPAWPAFLLWLLPIAEPPASAWAEPVSGILWYLVTYLWLVLLSPLLLRLYRRARVVAVLAPLALLPLFQVAPWPFGDRSASVIEDVLTFAACWLLGFAHRDGDLRRLPFGAVLAVSVVATGGAVGWVVTHHGAAGVDLADSPVAYAVYSIGFVLVLLRLAPRMDWLTSHRRADAAVTLLNSRAVTIYLWHNAAITAAFPLGDLLHVWAFGDTVAEVGYTAIGLWLLALVVLHVGWVEDLAARRRPRLVPV